MSSTMSDLSSLVDLAMPWPHFLLRASVVYVVLLVMVRLSGKRAIGQFTAFDMILLILLGTAVQNSLIGEDTSLLGGLILVATLIGLNVLVGFLAAQVPWFDRLIEGTPVLVARDGVVFEAVLRREHVSRGDFEEAMRAHGLTEQGQIQLAMLETDGHINIIQRKGDEPAS